MRAARSLEQLAGGRRDAVEQRMDRGGPDRSEPHMLVQDALVRLDHHGTQHALAKSLHARAARTRREREPAHSAAADDGRQQRGATAGLDGLGGDEATRARLEDDADAFATRCVKP